MPLAADRDRLAALVVPAWHAGLSVGHPLIDKHHILLLELTRSLVADLGSVDDATLRLAVDDLLQLAQRHCAAEEQLLEVNGYEWLEQHRDEHRAGLDRLRQVAGRHAPPAALREDFPRALLHWVVDHVADMDLPAREWFAHPDRPVGDVDATDPLDRPGR